MFLVFCDQQINGILRDGDFLIEFSVFGRVMSGSPALLRPACLLTEMVLFCI